MTYIIAEPCVGTTDTACVEVCPVDCIYLNNKDNEEASGKAPLIEDAFEVDGKVIDTLFIHPEECIDCGACEPECPVEAIFPEDEVPEKWNEYTAYNYEAFGFSAP
ncbi:MAG: ferredoxin family protein [bacterium]